MTETEHDMVVVDMNNPNLHRSLSEDDEVCADDMSTSSSAAEVFSPRRYV